MELITDGTESFTDFSDGNDSVDQLTVTSGITGGLGACCFMCITLFIISIDITIIIISQLINPNINCLIGYPFESIFMDIDQFALIGGVTGLIFSIIIFYLTQKLYKINGKALTFLQTKPTTNTLKLLQLLSGLFYLIWSIIGFIIYNNITYPCKQTPLGRVTLAWCILKLYNLCCTCIQLIYLNIYHYIFTIYYLYIPYIFVS